MATEVAKPVTDFFSKLGTRNPNPRMKPDVGN